MVNSANPDQTAPETNLGLHFQHRTMGLNI